MVAASATTGDAYPRTLAGRRLRPLLWLHVPKTGSSFATTVAHFGCPSLPANVTVMEPNAFSRRYKFMIWCPDSFRRFNSGHDPMPSGVAYEHVVSMFRAPRARLASGYFHKLHDCPALRRKECTTWGPLEPESNCDALLSRPLRDQVPQISAYSRCVEGCTAHMLAGKVCGMMGEHFKTVEEPEMLTDVYRLSSPRAPPFDADSLMKHSEERALNAIKHLGFVGLTEQWPLSVCLFHAAFGGKCYKASFANLRPGQHTDKYAGFYKVADWSMGIDETIYDAASRRFWSDVKANGVSVARCRQEICPDASEYFQEGVSFQIEDDDEF